MQEIFFGHCPFEGIVDLCRDSFHMTHFATLVR